MKWYRVAATLVVLALLIGLSVGLWRYGSAARPIRVGILHSMTGTMAISEKSMVDAELMAIEEINAKGGLLGRRIEPVVRDGKSDWPTFASEADRLIRDDKVCTIFGCWTSASRKTVKPVIEAHNHLLIYPMAYEGLEVSPNIIYTGAAPNQQITPAVYWGFSTLGKKRFFLVGSDYIWPHSVNEIVKDQLKSLGAELAGEEYVILGSDAFDGVIEKIKAAKPTIILSSVVGSSNIAFYRALRTAGIRPDDLPTLTVSIGEDELREISPQDMVGNYAAWNYFQSINRPENREWVRRFKARYGESRVTSDVIEAAYFSVHLWAQAVNDAGEDSVGEIRRAMLSQSLNAPEGVVSIDPETQHTWRIISIGKFRSDGQFDIVFTSEKPIRPVPYPISRSRVEWEDFLKNLYKGWGGTWANPGK